MRESHAGPLLVRQTASGKLPAFIGSLLHEGWLAQVLHERDEKALRHGKRHIWNVAVVGSQAELAALCRGHRGYVESKRVGLGG